MSIMSKLDAYLDWYAFVNQQEVEMAVCDFFQEEMGVEQLSFADNMEAWKIAKDYIEAKGLKFEPDLVITLDKKNKRIHLQDLNWEFNEAQVERMEKLYNNAFLNACDCLYYGYWRQAWNDCGLEDAEARVRVWEAAKQYLANDF